VADIDSAITDAVGSVIAEAIERAVAEAVERALGRPALTDDLAALSTERAAALLGVSPDTLWKAARDGDPPVPFFRCGRSLRWPAAPIRALLGLDQERASPGR
jgi:predicted DNA-binding transcriptional regulator AlpA